MNLITIDAETFYAKDYSLSKLTTEEYIRDPRFQIIGVSTKVNDEPAEWFSGTHRQIKEYLAQFDWANSAVLAHNMLFDGAILSWRLGIKPRVLLDTLSMARAVHGPDVSVSLKNLATRYDIGAKGEEVLQAIGKRRDDFTPTELAQYGRYCENDVDLCRKLFDIMSGGGNMGAPFPKSELKLIDHTLRMFTEPVLELDKPHLERHLSKTRAAKAELLAAAGADKKDLMSNPKFAALLESLGVEVPMKISPTTGKETYAFAKNDEEFKALADHEDLRVQTLVAARLGNKSTLEETRTERFIQIADRGAFPVPLRYYAAHTGRWGGADKINLQNLPSRGPAAGALKKAIYAPDGHVLIDSDSAQIEARVLAWLAGQEDVVEAFRSKQDVYKKMASAIYNVTEDDVTKSQRFVGKTTVLGAGYGMGGEKFRGALKTQGVEVPLPEAARIISVYRSANSDIVDLWKQAGDAIRGMARGNSCRIGRDGLIVADAYERAFILPNGLMIRYDDLREEPGDRGPQYSYKTRIGRTRIYGGKAVENCLTASTEVLTERGWVRIVDVAKSDRVWDGIQWVNHSGLIYQGERVTTVAYGVRMTPEHQVLTERGWRCASSCEGLHRAGFWLPDGSELRGDKWPTLALDLPLQVRERGAPCSHVGRAIHQAGRRLLLRLPSVWAKQHTRHVKAPSVLGVAVDARPMPAPDASGMAQLWRSWDQGVRDVGQVLRSFLGGYGAKLRAGADTGSTRQRWAVQPGELPVGGVQSAGAEPPKQPRSGYGESPRAYRNTSVNAQLSVGPEPVYDLRNAGPRSRFVVRGNDGPVIVHNCVQALARIVVGEQLIAIAKRYRVVLTVHDSIVACVRAEEAVEAKAYIEACMRVAPSWAPDLPINCEAAVGPNYGETE